MDTDVPARIDEERVEPRPTWRQRVRHVDRKLLLASLAIAVGVVLIVVALAQSVTGDDDASSLLPWSQAALATPGFFQSRRTGGGEGSSCNGTAGSTRTSASSGGGAVLAGASPTIGSVLVGGASRA